MLVEKPLALTSEQLDAIEAFYSETSSRWTCADDRFQPPLLTGGATAARKPLASREAPLVIDYRMNAGYIPLDHWVHGPHEGGGRNIGEACHVHDVFDALTGAGNGQEGDGCFDRPIEPAREKRQLQRDDRLRPRRICLHAHVHRARGKEHQKERMEVYADGRVLTLDDYRASRERPLVTVLVIAHGRQGPPTGAGNWLAQCSHRPDRGRSRSPSSCARRRSASTSRCSCERAAARPAVRGSASTARDVRLSRSASVAKAAAGAGAPRSPGGFRRARASARPEARARGRHCGALSSNSCNLGATNCGDPPVRDALSGRDLGCRGHGDRTEGGDSRRRRRLRSPAVSTCSARGEALCSAARSTGTRTSRPAIRGLRVPRGAWTTPDLGRPSDVKVPWELSRTALAPAGRPGVPPERMMSATPEAGLARCSEEWIDAEPVRATAPTGAVAMEAALRSRGLRRWDFHALRRQRRMARACTSGSRFLIMLFPAQRIRRAKYRTLRRERQPLHRRSAAGLVFAGLFFGAGEAPTRWSTQGWRILQEELPRQLTADGVDFEASVASTTSTATARVPGALPRADRPRCPRLVCGAPPGRRSICSRLHTIRRTPTPPLWGDADDARVLPLGGGALGDHRYLRGLVGAEYDGPTAEVAWVRGNEEASALAGAAPPETTAFVPAGFYVLRSGGDHLFGGLRAGRPRGARWSRPQRRPVVRARPRRYRARDRRRNNVYTADAVARNAFRSTAYHSTPKVDGARGESLSARAASGPSTTTPGPASKSWRPDGRRPAIRACHSGYLRLAEPVLVRRSLVLDLNRHAAAVLDEFDGTGRRRDRAWRPVRGQRRNGRVESGEGPRFSLTWSEGWEAALREGWESRRYGVREARRVLELRRQGRLLSLAMALTSASGNTAVLGSFVRGLLAR